MGDEVDETASVTLSTVTDVVASLIIVGLGWLLWHVSKQGLRFFFN